MIPVSEKLHLKIHQQHLIPETISLLLWIINQPLKTDLTARVDSRELPASFIQGCTIVMIIIITMHLFILTFFYAFMCNLLSPSHRVTSNCSCVQVQTVPLLSRYRSPGRGGYSVAAAVKSSGRTHTKKTYVMSLEAVLM